MIQFLTKAINVLMTHLEGWDQAFTLSATHFINYKALSLYILKRKKRKISARGIRVKNRGPFRF